MKKSPDPHRDFYLQIENMHSTSRKRPYACKCRRHFFRKTADAIFIKNADDRQLVEHKE